MFPHKIYQKIIITKIAYLTLLHRRYDMVYYPMTLRIYLFLAVISKSFCRYTESLAFGIILNPERALDLVDKGPAANLPEAEEFR